MYQKWNEQTVHWRYYETWGPAEKKEKKKGYVQVLYTLRTNNFLQNNHTRKQKHKIFVILPL